MLPRLDMPVFTCLDCKNETSMRGVQTLNAKRQISSPFNSVSILYNIIVLLPSLVSKMYCEQLLRRNWESSGYRTQFIPLTGTLSFKISSQRYVPCTLVMDVCLKTVRPILCRLYGSWSGRLWPVLVNRSLGNTHYNSHFNTIDFPVWISSTTASPGMKLNVSRASRLPSLSKAPHAEPAGASGLMGRSRYLGTFEEHSRSSRYIVIFHVSSMKFFTTKMNGAEFKLTAVKHAGVCELWPTWTWHEQYW